MLREPQLLAAYRDLASGGADRQARGAALERIVAQLFRAARLAVVPNAGAAGPRQTDLVATSADGTMYLIETKWRSKAANIGDLDSLRTRIDRAPSAIGILVSVNGFSKTVLDDLAARREHQILLIDGEELEHELSDAGDLRSLLNEKETALRVHGQVLLGSRAPRRSQARRPLGGGPAASATYFIQSDGTPADWVAGRGDFGQFTFTRSLTDPDWVPASGAGVTLDIGLPTESVDGIIDVLAELSDLRFASSSSHWCIQQADTNWHGMGGDNLATALQAWQTRYADLEHVHHTEQVCYQDVCEDGFYTLTFDVDASSRRVVWHAALSMALTGVPLEQEPIRELCSTLGVKQAVHFRPRTEKVLSRLNFGRADAEPLTVLASIVEHQPWDQGDPYWVAGIVVENPFVRPDRSTDDRIVDRDLGNYLAQSGLLLCDLKSWHPLGMPCDGYRLLSCEWGWTSDALVARMTADWDRGT
jgi:Holliday junction resolvase